MKHPKCIECYHSLTTYKEAQNAHGLNGATKSLDQGYLNSNQKEGWWVEKGLK